MKSKIIRLRKFISDFFRKSIYDSEYARYIIYPIVGLILVILICIISDSEICSFTYWGSESSLDRSSVLRNLGLILAGILAVSIAYWRSIVASLELKNSKQKTNIEKLHKAIELLESDSEISKLSGLEMLSELKNETSEFNRVLFQTIYAYLKKYASFKEDIKKFSKKYKSLDVDEKTRLWYIDAGRKPISILKAFELLIELNDDMIDNKSINLNQFNAFNELRINSFFLYNFPDRLIQESNFSYSTIRCKKNTSFSQCDLTGAVIIPFNNQTDIFKNCNISKLRIQVNDNINPIVNGWYWKDEPPLITSYWGYPGKEEDIRTIILPLDRIIDVKEKEKYYTEQFSGHPLYESLRLIDWLEKGQNIIRKKSKSYL